MALENITTGGANDFIDSLVTTNPVGATDPKSEGDDHIRNLKKAIKQTFPNITAAVTKTAAEINGLAADSAVVHNSLLSATGDIPYASAASTPARLPIGTASQVLLGGTIPNWGSVPAAALPVGTPVQTVNYQTGAAATGTTAIPNDDTIPQNTEGDEYMSLAITPTSATNKLKIEVTFIGASSGTADLKTVALFQDSTANALAAAKGNNSTPQAAETITFTHYMTAGTTSATTFKVRAGGIGGTLTFNGSASARLLGGILASSITITEIRA